LKELDELTMGLILRPGARARILEFLALEGTVLPDIRANTVQDALESGKLTETGKQLLELRKVLSKTSTRKYQSFIDRGDSSDHRVRDISMYHGASTGRDSGTGVQIQNFPRPVIDINRNRPYQPVEDARNCDSEFLKLLYGDNLSLLFSSILRNMVIASPGMELFVADFSKIEVVVGWWLCNNEPGLSILHAGGDPYKRLAAMNTGRRYEDIDDDGLERQLAKRQILGCMYGMGWEKFQRTAIEQDRLSLSDDQSKTAVKQYRTTFPKVPGFWREIENAAIAAVRAKNHRVQFPHGAFAMDSGYLWMVLPSGRRIAYHSPRIVWRVNEYSGEEQETLEFMGVNSRTKHWTTERTWGGVLFENLVQAVARDLMMYRLAPMIRAGYRPLITVHDEIVAERERGRGSLSEFIGILCERPQWADSKLLLEAKGYVNERYRK
jgi:DNA polymerase